MNVIAQKKINAESWRVRHQLRWLIWLFFYGGLFFTVSPVQAAVNPDVAPGCLNLVEGGNFDQFNPSWQITASTRPPMYSGEQTFNGSVQALRLGNGVELPNIESVSEARHKPIVLPIGATRIILRFLYYPLFDAAPGADLQQADLFDATTDQLIGSLLNAQDDARAWKARDFDLTLYAGRTISLRFRVRNDGVAGRTLMYIDNVELEYCAQAPLPTLTSTLSPTPSGTPLPIVTPTPSLTPLTVTPVTATFTPIVIPTALPPEDLSCPNILVNGNFEGVDGWHIGEDPVPPRYVNTFFQEGARSVLLGNPPENPTNVTTFSSVRQLVTIPFTTGPIQLRWWRLPYTAQAGGPTTTTDRQDLILLSPQLKPIQILRRELRNDGIWLEDAFDLTAYRGQTLYIYFNVFNDANNARTWMYLDNVRLRVCGAPAAAPTSMAPFGPATPIAIPLTPPATYTLAPMPTPSPFPTLSATPLPLPSPTMTATVAAALAPVVPLATNAATVTAENLASAVTSTTNVYPLPTLPTQTVVEATAVIGSPPAVAAAPFRVAPQTPQIATPTAVVNQPPISTDRLGAVAVLFGILVIIAFIVLGIMRIFRHPS